MSTAVERQSTPIVALGTLDRTYHQGIAMSFYYIDTGTIRSSKGTEEGSEMDAFKTCWAHVMDSAYMTATVSYQYHDGSKETATFNEVPYPLTSDEADEILDVVGSGEFRHLRKHLQKRAYDLPTFVDGKETKGQLVADSLTYNLDELREHCGEPQR